MGTLKSLRLPSSLPFLALACLVVTGSAAPPARAAIVYSTFGPGDSYDGGIGYTVSTAASSVGSNQDVAMSFTVTGTDYEFTSAELAMFHVSGTNLLDILLMTDAGGLPGTVIETLPITVPSMGIVTASSTLMPTLTVGTTYWLATDASANIWAAWNWTSPLQIGPTAFSVDGGANWTSSPNNQLSAFRINGTPLNDTTVPEPTSLTLAAMGGLLLLCKVRRRRAV